MNLKEIRLASIARHEENRQRAIQENAWIFDESISEVGLAGGAILAPDGASVAYVYTYEEGWRERVVALLEAANRQGEDRKKRQETGNGPE